MKGFTDGERERIKSSLVKEGRELIAQFGIDRTRIADITDSVGIGTSTFYQFFDSKEELYLEILEAELESINTDIRNKLEETEPLEKGIRQALQLMFEELETNQIYYRLLVEDDWDLLSRRLPNDRLQENYTESVMIFLPIVNELTSHESFTADDPETIINMFRSIAQVVRMKEEFAAYGSPGSYDNARNLLIEVVTRGLTSA